MKAIVGTLLLGGKWEAIAQFLRGKRHVLTF